MLNSRGVFGGVILINTLLKIFGLRCVGARQEAFAFNCWKAALISACCIPTYIIQLFSIWGWFSKDSWWEIFAKSKWREQQLSLDFAVEKCFLAVIFTIITGENSLAIVSIFDNSLQVICLYQIILWTGYGFRDWDSHSILCHLPCEQARLFCHSVHILSSC